MKRYTLFLLLLFIVSCKTTKEDYSQYPFIGENIKSNIYEIVTLINNDEKLTNVYGYYVPLERVVNENSDSEKIKKIMTMPLIFFKSPDNLYFTIDNEKIKSNFLIEYNIKENKIDSLKVFLGEDYAIWLNTLEQFYKQQNTTFIDFKFSEAEKYYKIVKTEDRGYISNDDINRIEKTYNTEEKRKKAIDITTYYYTTNYIKINMPKETLEFKYNLSPNGKLLFFGNEELYKKGYICIYVYKSSGNIEYSSGLYIIRPKNK